MSILDAQARGGASTVPSLLIRPAQAAELEAVGHLTYAAYAHDYADLPADYREQLQHPEALAEDFEFFVAVDPESGEFVGTIAILREGHGHRDRVGADELYFRLLATSPSARGRGIGIALTNFAIDRARERGLVRVVMNSGPYMLGAHALYFKLGFRRESAREGTIVIDGRELTLLTFVLDV